jgi:predicted dehydrogenase
MSDTVGVALVGYGYWGANLARNISAARSTHLVGVCERDDGQRAAAARAFPGAQAWTDLDDVLADGDVDAVALATPASLHEEMALAVIAAGRHVLVEKPLAMTPAGADRVVDAAEAAARVVMVGHTFLYAEPVLRIRDYIERGDLGKVQYLYSQRLSLGRIRRDCNALWNFAPHDVAIMLYLLGERPVTVTGKGFAFIQSDIEDVCFASLTFPSGVGANLHVSWIDPRKTRLMTVVGDEKMLIYNDVSADQKLWLVDAGVARSPEGFGEYESLGEFQWKTRAGDIIIPSLSLTEPLLAELDAFGRACRGEDTNRTDARHGADVVRVLSAVDESARDNGRPVTIDWGGR